MNHPVLNSGLSISHLALYEQLRDLRNRVPEEFRALFVFLPPIIHRAVLHKFGWWVLQGNTAEFNRPKLRLFWELLASREYITCSYEAFEIHFIHDKKFPEDKIMWEGDVMILVYLFDILMYDKKIMPPASNLYDTLCDHFLWKDKKSHTIKQLNRTSLKSSLNKAKSKPAVQGIAKNITALLLS